MPWAARRRRSRSRARLVASSMMPERSLSIMRKGWGSLHTPAAGSVAATRARSLPSRLDRRSGPFRARARRLTRCLRTFRRRRASRKDTSDRLARTLAPRVTRGRGLTRASLACRWSWLLKAARGRNAVAVSRVACRTCREVLIPSARTRGRILRTAETNIGRDVASGVTPGGATPRTRDLRSPDVGSARVLVLDPALRGIWTRARVRPLGCLPGVGAQFVPSNSRCDLPIAARAIETSPR